MGFGPKLLRSRPGLSRDVKGHCDAGVTNSAMLPYPPLLPLASPSFSIHCRPSLHSSSPIHHLTCPQVLATPRSPTRHSPSWPSPASASFLPVRIFTSVETLLLFAHLLTNVGLGRAGSQLPLFLWLHQGIVHVNSSMSTD